MKSSLLLGALTFAITSSLASAGLVTKYNNVSSFTDFRYSERSPASTQKAFDYQIKRQRSLTGWIGNNRTLEITFTDVDLAGRYEPFNFRGGSNPRVIRDLYPPRLKFNYVLKDASGRKIRSGSANISDNTFLLGARRNLGGRPFYYEFELLRDWMRKTIPKA
ncbi:MAG: DUF3016 domain-containing protein [Verrucomicrobiota bacterium]